MTLNSTDRRRLAAVMFAGMVGRLVTGRVPLRGIAPPVRTSRRSCPPDRIHSFPVRHGEVADLALDRNSGVGAVLLAGVNEVKAGHVAVEPLEDLLVAGQL